MPTTSQTVSPQHDAMTRLARLNCDESPTKPIATLTDSYVVKNKPAAKQQLKGSMKDISIYFFFLPITQWCSISNVPFTGGRGVSDFSVLKYY